MVSASVRGLALHRVIQCDEPEGCLSPEVHIVATNFHRVPVQHDDAIDPSTWFNHHFGHSTTAQSGPVPSTDGHCTADEYDSCPSEHGHLNRKAFCNFGRRLLDSRGHFIIQQRLAVFHCKHNMMVNLPRIVRSLPVFFAPLIPYRQKVPENRIPIASYGESQVEFRDCLLP